MALLARYGFNEGSGTTAADGSGNGRNLTASNTSSSWGTGRGGGSGARVEHNGAMGPNVSQASFSVLMWLMRTGTWTSWAAAFVQGTTWLLESDAADNYCLNWFDGTTSIHAAGAQLPLNEWVHVAMVNDAGARTLLVNGWPVGTATGSTARNFSTSCCAATGPTGVAAGETSNFGGVVDDLSTFDTALTTGEVQNWMNTPIPLPTPLTLNASAMAAMRGAFYG